MRSELVFKALAYESNRYQLVHSVAKGTRKLHRPFTRLEETTNVVLERFVGEASRIEARKIEAADIEALWLERSRAA
jgi:hypothetical protein